MLYNPLDDRSKYRPSWTDVPLVLLNIFAIKIGTFENRLQRLRGVARCFFMSDEDMGNILIERGLVYDIIDFLEVNYWGDDIAEPENWRKLRVLHQRYGDNFLKAIFELNNYNEPWPTNSTEFYRRLEDLYYAVDGTDRAERRLSGLLLSRFAVVNFEDPEPLAKMLREITAIIDSQYQGSDCWLEDNFVIPSIVIQPVEIK
jgi:hypothetical protein